MKLKLFIVLFLIVSVSAVAEIRQELGADQSVDYASLTQYGPWDDRNYQLTASDLALLPANDQYLRNVPVFYKVWARKQNPGMGDFYPRELYQTFLINFGGLVIDGHWYKEGLGLYHHPNNLNGTADKNYRGGTVDPDLEVLLTAGAESTIEFNPDNNMQAVAGVNAGGGQSMFYSTDGGVNWSLSQVNSGSCCDPTIDWSTTAVSPQRVYQADLGNCGAVCNIRASWSDDGGQTWAPMITIDGDQQNDKEFIHVDRSPTSPFRDNVYITYHKNNQMRFARSTDHGETWSTPINVGSDTGIGSDITTDSAGNIYYIYPGLSGSGINMIKSTDGGLTFQPVVQVSTIRGIFDFPIPAMETREVFIYAAVDVDSNDNIYVAITDETAGSTGGGTGSAANNHAEIRVFKSTDGGANWNELPSPHPTADAATVDRFHPWMMVGENDAIHIGFYDTRNSTNRTGVDFYYNVSTDGGASWLAEGAQRFSTQTSTNISGGFEWGDYNGLSVVNDKLAMIWTDHRGSPTNTLVGLVTNQFGSPFNVTANPSSISVCANDINNTITLDIVGFQGYAGTITLSEDSVPGYVNNGAFSTNGQVAPFTSDYTFDVDNSGTTGTDSLILLATGDDNGDITTVNVSVDVTYSGGAAGVVTLQTPADMSSGVTVQPTFSWTVDANATAYMIEVATDIQFNNIVVSETVNTNSYQVASDLQTVTEYYWRVTALSPCGDTVSSVYSFTTQVAPGDCPIGTVQSDVYNYAFEISSDVIFGHQFDTPTGYVGGDSTDEGFTVQTGTGDVNWALENVGNGGSVAFQADDLPTVNDTSLLTPVMNLPVGVGPLTLRFWNTQTIEDRTGGCYDSATLEVSVDGGLFTQVTNADIINDPYNGPTDGGFGHPLPAGTQAWCGDPMAATEFSVDINAYAGQDVQFAFRMTSDSSVGRTAGWAIDDVRVTGCEAP
ncbi:MAG: hypothetical protein R3E90_11100 [Marinicella sp.]